MSLFNELKRRNVFRVAIAYLVGAWLFTQVADVVLGVISAPDTAMRAVVAILALAFIPTVIFAWVYEMTPDGVKKASEIDAEMAATGEGIYNQMCLACHRIGQKFIGPAPNGVLERRSPEWVMNMILNPEGMVKEDPLAKDLLMEFNGSPMANQGLTQEQARAVLEYFRTLK